MPRTRPEENTSVEHEWERKWSLRDFQTHIVELKQIESEWDGMMKTFREGGDHPEIAYQNAHGGMDGVVALYAEADEFQKYDLNHWKLDKMRYWKDNIKPSVIEREQIQERNRKAIKEIGEGIKNLSFKV